MVPFSVFVKVVMVPFSVFVKVVMVPEFLKVPEIVPVLVKVVMVPSSFAPDAPNAQVPLLIKFVIV